MAYNQDPKEDRSSDDEYNNEASLGLISEQPRKSKRKETCTKTFLLMLLIASNVVWIAAVSGTWYGTKDVLRRCGSNRYPADFGTLVYMIYDGMLTKSIQFREKQYRSSSRQSTLTIFSNTIPPATKSTEK